MRAISLLPILALTLAACGDKDDTQNPEGDTDADSDSDTDTDADADADTDADSDADTDADADPDAPVLSDPNAWCAEAGTTSPYFQWIAIAQATDPQGADTIDAFDMENNLVEVSDGGTFVVSYPLVCGKGECTASFREDANDVLCANATDYTFTFRVADEDGNVSAPVTATGRQGE